MLRRGLVKCSNLFFIVFLMCPRLLMRLTIANFLLAQVLLKMSPGLYFPGKDISVAVQTLELCLFDGKRLALIPWDLNKTGIRPTAIGKQNYFHAVRRSNDLDVNLRARPHELGRRSPQDVEDIYYKSAVDNEPGFDLSDDEIRKLKLWPKGIIPYYIDAVSFNDKVLRDRIRLFLNSVNSQTRLSFLELPSPPKDENTRWVFFANRRGQLGCADHSILNFTNEGVQHVNLGYDCLSTNGELGEAVLAIAGVPPQHNSPDRDEYITIVEENIMPEKRYLFRKLNNDEWLFHDMEYDINSASHYHHHKYSINGRATIELAIEILKGLQSPLLNDIQERHEFSRQDIEKLRMLYNYIVKKKENKVPECDKLFRKGYNFDNEGPVNHPEITKPRKKPNKYLGLLEEPYDFNKDPNSASISENKQDNGDDKGADSEANNKLALEEYAGAKVDYENETEDNDENVAAPKKIDLKSRPTKLKHKSGKIHPLYLSNDKAHGRKRKASEKKNTTLKAVNMSSIA